MLFDDALTNCESKPGTSRSRAETRLEDTRNIFRRNSRPGITHYDFDAAVLRSLRINALRINARNIAAPLNRQPSPRQA